MSWKKFIGGFDLHGDKADPKASSKILEFCEIWKPDIRWFGGDLWDFRQLRNGASKEEQQESMKADFEAGMDWLQKFRPDYFVRGNHDERLWELAEKQDGVRSDYAALGVAKIEAHIKRSKCKMLPYHKRDGVLRLGKLKILHGFFCGVYAARQNALVYDSCLFGHVHDVAEHSIPKLKRTVARACGCLCDLDMEYAARTPNTLRQAHGWPYGVIHDRTGEYHVWQAEEINGHYMIPSDIVEL